MWYLRAAWPHRQQIIWVKNMMILFETVCLSVCLSLGRCLWGLSNCVIQLCESNGNSQWSLIGRRPPGCVCVCVCVCVWADRLGNSVSAEWFGWMLSFLWAIWLRPKQITNSLTDCEAAPTSNRPWDVLMEWNPTSIVHNCISSSVTNCIFAVVYYYLRVLKPRII